MRNEAAVEALLEQAAPRPVPPAAHAAVIRQAVEAEWQSTVGRTRVRRRMTNLAVAATVLLGVVVGLNALQTTQPSAALQVAAINSHRGAIYLVGEQALLQEMTHISSVYAGQIIETGDDGGLSLDWGSGGTLRIDRKTRVEFESADSVYLRFGQVYFDSGSEAIAAITGSALEIGTDYGLVRHLGTQYMTSIDGRDLVVRVREGSVAIDGNYVEEAVAVAGQQLRISGGSKPEILDIDGFGATWSWVEALAPSVNKDGWTTWEFLRHIGRETGLAIEYETPAAEAEARRGRLVGTIDTDPRHELELRMAGEDLGYRIDEGTIYVRIDSLSR